MGFGMRKFRVFPERWRAIPKHDKYGRLRTSTYNFKIGQALYISGRGYDDAFESLPVKARASRKKHHAKLMRYLNISLRGKAK
jgi:hypothetical protein